MGDVWVARNEATHAEVAVKTLHRSERTPVHDERFRREARLAATITHRNVVRVFDLVDESDGTLGLVMELLRGATLEDALRERGAFTSIQAAAVAVSALSAMQHVHQKGIIHRDLKPSNVFFAVEPDGHVIPKVLDFGIAKLPAAGSALTVDGSVLGTPHYMSPEQIRGKGDIDGRSDMFSLAVVLYEMLTSVRVFDRDSASASLAAVLEHDVDPDPRIEPRLWLAISRALSKRAYERYATCAEFAEAIRSALGATDQQIADALQELRPRADVVPNSTNNVANLAFSAELRDARPRRWVAIAAVGLAVGTIALVLELMVGGRTSTGPITPASTSSIRPGETPIGSVSNGLVPSAEPPRTASEPAPPALPEGPRPAIIATPSAKRGAPKAASSKPRPSGVATTPGF